MNYYVPKVTYVPVILVAAFYLYFYALHGVGAVFRMHTTVFVLHDVPGKDAKM